MRFIALAAVLGSFLVTLPVSLATASSAACAIGVNCQPACATLAGCKPNGI